MLVAAEALLVASRVTIGATANLKPDKRIELYAALICREICLLPPSERDARLAAVIADLPEAYKATVESMRMILVMQAREEPSSL